VATDTLRMTHMMRKQRGVTLMELLVVLVIIGILTAIAYPTYRAQVRRSNRTEARVVLEQTAGALEKCYTRYMAYNDIANCPAANQFNGGATINTPNVFYRISAPTLNGTQFILRADAQNGQTTDTGCTRLELDQTGNRTPATCW
jgi:type IV pilus assembly protein PilE